MLVQLITLIGSLCVLGGYFLNQTGKVAYTSWWYMALNLCGSLLLGGISLYFMLYGYILLNGVWGVITLHAMYRRFYGMV